MRDTRELRFAVAIGLSAAITAIFGEVFLRPRIMKGVRK